MKISLSPLNWGFGGITNNTNKANGKNPTIQGLVFITSKHGYKDKANNEGEYLCQKR
ncbi:hypothetical protein BTHERMOSOX_1043 [Bathymodiolus thermophilus thioautotrophic gill symbiont]|nr:hypothetical protein BTHERMOSOX_1043 [Bathymodiolus thermophilus thioautotrophic gill symbiont]